MTKEQIDKTLYTENSIESLSPLEFTRLRPGVYAGDTTYATQLLVEILSNAIDEYRLGHGDKIDVKIDKDIVSVQDYGQGFIPDSYREDGKTILEAAFSVLNTSGKYREDGTYEGTSLGSFGIGSKITTFLSHWLDVMTVRDGKCETISFKEGVFNNRETYPTRAESGTYVKWQPSEEFFTHTTVELNKVKTLFKTITALCPGLTINLDANGEQTTYISKNGINDLVDEAVKDKELIDNRFIMNFTENKNKMDMVMTYTSSYGSTLIPYVNTGLTESGQHITQVKAIFTREFNKFFKEKKWLKENEENLTGDDIQEGMYVIFNITAPGVAYDAQVKSRITKIDMTPFTRAIIDNLNAWMNANEKEVKMIAEKGINARKAREAAKKARDTARDTALKPTGRKKDLKDKLALSEKFINCQSDNPKEKELLIVEGLSAGTSAVEARNPKTQAIEMIRGKCINVLKSSKERVINNQEYHDIIDVIGAGFDDTFDVRKMQFDKIVITSDSDPDGSSIALLLATFFWKYMRPLVLEGHLYRALTPLYTATYKGKDYYLYNEQELEEFRYGKDINKISLAHAKGLGELNAQDLKKVCFDAKNYERITVEDIEATNALFEILMGESVPPRKQYLYDNADFMKEIVE